MPHALVSKENDCRSCYKCIRACPTKSISFQNGQAKIITSECVLCGNCYLVCPQECKIIRDDKAKAYSLLEEKKEVYASLAPSFYAYYEGSSFADLKEALLSLGFKGVEETALGATLIKRRYEELLKEGKKEVYISTCCHSINLLVERYYPDLTENLAPVLSPMLAHAEVIKKEHKEAKVIFIGPCISKKDEIDRNPSYVDVVLTFAELDEMLQEKGITLKKTRNIEEKKTHSRARLFPVEGGILDTMDKSEAWQYIAVGGMEEAMEALEEVRQGKFHHTFIEMSACPGSCINGPIPRKKHNAPYSGLISIREAAGKEDFSIESEASFTRLFTKNPKAEHHFSPQEIEKVLTQIGKRSKKDELNCSSCGYPTCRAKAVAVLEGKASLEMCLPYLMEKAQNFSDTIVEESENAILVCNESLEVELANPEMARLVGVASASDLKGKGINAIMDPEPFALALGGQPLKDRKIYLAEYGKYLISTITYEEKFHVLIGVFRDVTREEKARSEAQERARNTAETVNEVVEKHMRTVQEIASLLGESAAETKLALNKLKEALPGEDNDR